MFGSTENWRSSIGFGGAKREFDLKAPLIVVRIQDFASLGVDHVGALTGQTGDRHQSILVIRIVGYPSRYVLANYGTATEDSRHSAA
jgi:hypothetical protein